MGTSVQLALRFTTEQHAGELVVFEVGQIFLATTSLPACLGLLWLAARRLGAIGLELTNGVDVKPNPPGAAVRAALVHASQRAGLPPLLNRRARDFEVRAHW